MLSKRFLTIRDRRVFYILLTMAIALAFFKAYSSYKIASSINDYISDEVWYASSTRNIMNDVLGLNTVYKVNNTPVYTIFAYSHSDLKHIIDKVVENGGFIVKDDYKNVIAVAVACNESLDWLKSLPGVLKVTPGYPQPDESNIMDYYNQEHPPLAKYLIGLSMILLGDKPLSWRIPGIIEASLLVLIAALIGWRLLGAFGMIIASLALALDPLTTRMGAIAMLDIHLAFFTALSLMFYLYDRYYLALLAACLSFLVKFSGLFTLAALYVSLRARGYRASRLIPIFILTLVFTSLILYTPFISYFGVSEVINKFIGALKWHTTSRPAGPVTSNPLDWILGANSFILYLNPELLAKGSPIIYVPSFVISLIIAPLAVYPGKLGVFGRRASIVALWGVFLTLGYFLIMLLGNRTLYSFYMTQASPVLCSFLPAAIYILVFDDKLIGKSVSYVSSTVKDLLQGRIYNFRVPGEIGFLERVFKANRRIQGYYAIAFSVAIASLLLHLNLGSPYKLYSDATWILSNGFRGDPSRLMGVTGALYIILGKAGLDGNSLILIDAVFLLLSLIELERLYSKAGVRHPEYLFLITLSLLLYGVYDGSSLSLFMFLLGINLYHELRGYMRLIGAFIAGLSVNNIFMLTLTLAMFSVDSILALAVSSTASALAMAPSIMYTGLSINELLSRSPLAYLFKPEAPGFASILGSYSITLGVLMLLLTVYTVINLRRRGVGVIDSMLVLAPLVYALAPSIPPQWLLPALAIITIRGYRMPLLTWITDLSNALVIMLWFSTPFIMHSLFKYTPASQLSPLALTCVSSYIRSIALLVIAWRVYSKLMKGVGVERAKLSGL